MKALSGSENDFNIIKGLIDLYRALVQYVDILRLLYMYMCCNIFFILSIEQFCSFLLKRWLETNMEML